MPGRGGVSGWAGGVVLATLLAAAPAAAKGVALPSDWVPGFCAGIDGIIRAEGDRAAADFAPSLAAVVADVIAERRMALGPTLTADEAANAARRLWALWLPIAPAASVGIVDDGPGRWLFAPPPDWDPPYTGDPIRIEKADGAVTWALPDPSERERLRAQVCGPAPAGP